MDDNPNAFINHKRNLYISTGLLKYAESYETLIGVLAHEIGHLENFHINKRKDTIKNLTKIDNLINTTIIASSLISKKNKYLAESLLTNKIGINNYFQSFSRDQEREADYYAIETLNKLNLSKTPLVNFLKFLEKKSIQKGMNNEFYLLSSHPIYQERYDIINNKTNFGQFRHDVVLNQNFNYIKAKFFGFTEINENLINIYLDEDYKTYAQSIIFSKQGKLKKSLVLLNSIIKKKKNYTFLLETKADILYSNGFFSEALLFYEKSIEIEKNNNYVQKRIFDIEFNKKNLYKKEIAKELFQKNSYLLNIFTNNHKLKDQFKELANKADIEEWINFFSYEEKFYKNIIKKNEVINLMNEIEKKSKDINLKKIIIRFNQNV